MYMRISQYLMVPAANIAFIVNFNKDIPVAAFKQPVHRIINGRIDGIIPFQVLVLPEIEDPNYGYNSQFIGLFQDS